jgi:alpha-L-fucosidase
MTPNMPRSTGRRTSGSNPRKASTRRTDWTYVSEAWTRDWLARDTELVEKYKPEVVYFDWWIAHPVFRGAAAQFAAFYYNYAAANGYTGVINFKEYSMNWKAGVRDFERGQQDHILADHWQTDTSISNKSWGYIENDTFKTPEFLVRQLVDIVSKNGNLLLNIGPRADGTIPDNVKATLLEIGAWLKVNGEAIYATTPWKSFGEGPTEVKAGSFHDSETKPYTAKDFALRLRERRCTRSEWLARRMGRRPSTRWAGRTKGIPFPSLRLSCLGLKTK